MLNFADRTGYGVFMVLWPQMGGKGVHTVIKGCARGAARQARRAARGRVWEERMGGTRGGGELREREGGIGKGIGVRRECRV